MIWNYTYTPYIWPMLASALFAAGIAIYAWRHRVVPGGAAFAIQTLGVAFWALFTAMEIAAVNDPTRILHHRLEAASALISMAGLIYFALVHASLGKLATRRNLLLLIGVTLGFLILMATNDLHHLLWTGFHFDRFLRVERGPLNFLLVAWAFLIPVLALIVFMRLFLRSKGTYRYQAILLFIGTALPVLTYLLEPAGINPIAPLDPVILVWNVSSLLYTLAIFRFRMLEVVPIGRDTAIERTPNGVMILDAKNRIVDLNPMAREVLSLPLKAAIGQPVQKALQSHPNLAGLLEQETVDGAEIELGGNGQTRYFEVKSSELVHSGGFRMGRLVFLRNVTEQRQAQAKIIEQQRAG
jgi:PAS domain S-box-containing protein